jgi:hypothetical protein
VFSSEFIANKLSPSHLIISSGSGNRLKKSKRKIVNILNKNPKAITIQSTDPALPLFFCASIFP